MFSAAVAGVGCSWIMSARISITLCCRSGVLIVVKALVVTVTCNPAWPEITSALPEGAHWQDHPDIVSRAFMLKLNAIVNDLKHGSLFGVLRAYVFRVEWQARGNADVGDVDIR